MLHGRGARDIGHLDRVVEIYNRQAADTDYSFKEANVLVSEEFAEELPRTRKMREDIMGGKESSIQEVHFRIRKETPVTTKHFIRYDGMWYDIITILPEGRDYQVLVTELRHDSQFT
jgi:head-tail adaptor